MHRVSAFSCVLFSGFHPGAHRFDDSRQDRNDDDRHDEQFEVMLYERQVPEKVAGIAEQCYPGGSADQVERHETGIVHPAHSGDEWCEGADDRHETGEDDGLPAVFFVKRLCFVHVALLEDPGVRIVEEPATEEAADHIVAGIAGYGRGEKDQDEEVYLDRNAGQGRNGPCYEQQRVAGKERGDDQSGFAENDEKKDGVCPQVIVLDDTDKVLIDMQDEIRQKFHKELDMFEGDGTSALRPERAKEERRVRPTTVNGAKCACVPARRYNNGKNP